jgi:hypothetical protein
VEKQKVWTGPVIAGVIIAGVGVLAEIYFGLRPTDPQHPYSFDFMFASASIPILPLVLVFLGLGGTCIVLLRRKPRTDPIIDQAEEAVISGLKSDVLMERRNLADAQKRIALLERANVALQQKQLPTRIDALITAKTVRPRSEAGRLLPNEVPNSLPSRRTALSFVSRAGRR